ncbi:MAG: hypothetical protein GH150_04745 [Hadesarchaea archaeon]|nr:hypothetical protein [Hadesarchaea archaeon]
MTRPIAQDNLCDYPLFKHYNNGCPDLLDAKILHILVRHALAYPKTFFGLSSTNLLRAVHDQSMRGSSRCFTLKEIGEVRRALLTLERDGHIYHIKRSKPRWFPTIHAITAHAFAAGTQTTLGRWL